MRPLAIIVGFVCVAGLAVLLFAFAEKSGALKIIDEKVGSGAEAMKGDMVAVHYTGRLSDGSKFDSSFDHEDPKPLVFVLGKGEVIKGWDEGVVGMKIGGKRKLVIPPELGYGERGAGRKIPPNSELHFDVELMGIKGKDERKN